MTAHAQMMPSAERLERFRRQSGNDGVQGHAENGDDGGHCDAAIGHAGLVHLQVRPEPSGNRHGVQNAASGIKTGIERGQHGGQNDEVHDHIRALHTDGAEEGDEGLSPAL